MLSRLFIFAALLSFFSGCASLNDALTPSLSIQKDDFDGMIIIEQPPVSAASKMSEGWHTLGFQWYQKHPNDVFLQVGVSGITNVMGVAFNVDGEVLQDIDKASKLTNYGDRSTRRLVMPLSDFMKVANGKDVKMKVMQIDTYSVSSFGSSNPDARINTKFEPFINKIKEIQNAK